MPISIPTNPTFLAYASFIPLKREKVEWKTGCVLQHWLRYNSQVDLPMPIYENSKSLIFEEKASLKAMVLLARHLRNNLTPTETILWERIRKKRLAGLKFRRQHVFGTSIVDFYCPEKHSAFTNNLAKGSKP